METIPCSSIGTALGLANYKKETASENVLSMCHDWYTMKYLIICRDANEIKEGFCSW